MGIFGEKVTLKEVLTSCLVIGITVVIMSFILTPKYGQTTQYKKLTKKEAQEKVKTMIEMSKTDEERKALQGLLEAVENYQP